MLGMGIWVHPYTDTCAGGGEFWKIGGSWSPNVDVYKVFEHLHMLWMGIIWVMGAPLHCYACAGGKQILENWVEVEYK